MVKITVTVYSTDNSRTLSGEYDIGNDALYFKMSDWLAVGFDYEQELLSDLRKFADNVGASLDLVMKLDSLTNLEKFDSLVVTDGDKSVDVRLSS